MKSGCAARTASCARRSSIFARRHAIVTPYTSYLIVEDEARRGVPVAQRSLQELDRNRDAQARFKSSWEAMPAEKAGLAGNSYARANQSLKFAESLDGAQTLSKSEARRAYTAAPSAPAAAGRTPLPAQTLAAVEQQLNAVEQQTRVVRGKSFFQNGAQWIDADAQKQKGAKPQRVQFASDEYFRLLAENTDAAQWLALGPNVQFSLGDKLYEVHE